MNLVVFDIDGTLVDSVKADDECFIQSFQDLHNIDLSGADWNDFTHVTDSGLTAEIFETHLNRRPTESETLKLKAHFHKLLHRRKAEITEIRGGSNTLDLLNQHPEFSVAFATGGWKETAELKLSTLDFEWNELPLVSANDHFSRSEITRLAIEQSLKRERLTQFDSITYIGDGLWDFKTSKKLGIHFIGIDHAQNAKLSKAGASRVMLDLSNTEQIMKWAAH